ncbi:DUF1302 domain-containing protein [Sandarakinorhabdus rubra]|uniref:hypothetical protein n=1 Tax=Sandarakinorhabdus rubra TaxID=2672568 RepID=UPI0013D922A1|nr:hypothetical protein [Sandarakinorhabdus rubra]
MAETGLADTLGLRLSARAGVWTHDRDLNGETLVPMLGVRARIAPKAGVLDGRAEAYAQIDRTGRWRTDAVEAWARLAVGEVELRAGRQIIVWGRADRLNPTDNLSGRDYTLLAASDDDQRQGPAMVQGRWGRGNLTVDAIWLPEFRPNIFPLERSRPGIAVLPDEQRRASSQFALKLDSSGGAFDWSLSWFRGIDRNRDFTARPALPGTIAALQQTFPDISVLGADAAGTIGTVGWRVEAAHTRVLGADTVFIKNDNLWLVAGGDVNLAGGWNINLQYSLRVIFDHRDPRLIADPVTRSVATLSAAVNNQLDRVQNGVTFRLARRFANDSAEAEIAVIHYLEPGDTALRPRLSTSIRDGLRLAVGADIFTGPSNSYFGRVRSLSAGWLQLTAGY